MTFPELVTPLAERRELSDSQAAELMHFLMSGEATDGQIGAVLLGLRVKGCTAGELAAFVRVLREKAMMLCHPFEDVVDTCGTGGGCESFNISTAAAIVASASGVRIAKHGNRGVTSTCGSADVLESLGVKIVSDPEALTKTLTEIGIVFMFAPSHHPAMKFVGPVRKQIGIRTVFNQLGPLLNPAGAKRQLIGVFDQSLMDSMGGALNKLGCERALLVHGVDGLDEVSPTGSTNYVKVWHGEVSTGRLDLDEFDLKPVEPKSILPGATAEENGRILIEAITDADSPRSHAVLPSAAAAIWIAGITDELSDAVDVARHSIRSGLAKAKLNQLIAAGAP